MKTVQVLLWIAMMAGSWMSYGQAQRVDVEEKRFRTSEKKKINGEVGYLEVPENRKNPTSRSIRLKYVHLKSLAQNPGIPVIFLEGGGGASTWQVESPDDLSDWLEILEVSDLIFFDRRGAEDESLSYIWMEDYPAGFLLSEQEAYAHYQKMVEAVLDTFSATPIDIKGYNVEEQARDVNDLMTLLGFDTYALWGFSYGSHIGMTVMTLFPDQVERAILVGADAPHQAMNFPHYLEDHIAKVADMVASDPTVNKDVPDFRALVDRVMQQLSAEPAQVTVKNPLTGRDMDLEVGPFGLALILRLDIDDASDIPVLPRLLYTIERGDYKMLTWFAQRRMVFGLALPVGDINQQLASGAADTRWEQIEKEASQSLFGNVVNFPFGAAREHWPSQALSYDAGVPMTSDIPTLFITGTLDSRTPVEQVEETRKGFSNAVHIKVENAGHEQALWNQQTFDESIPAFLRGERLEDASHYYKDLEFVPVRGEVTGHPSLR
ncbi:MAG: alpha/beta fold hydrolase [Bacteroidota bacterium]